MSHFSVIVLSKTDNIFDIEAMLQPYHEYECTGTNDQYVQDIDVTSDFIERYLNEQREYAFHPDGRQLSVNDDIFYRELTDEENAGLGPFCSSMFINGKCISSKDWNDGKGYRPKIHDIPSPWELKKKSVKDYMSPYTFLMDDDEYSACHHNEELDIAGAHKWGYALVDENLNIIKVVNRTNPNYKWDWWEVGGRWKKYFIGKDGLKYDQIKRSDCDIEAMIELNASNAALDYDLYAKIADGRTSETWEAVKLKFDNIEDSRAFYHEQPVVKDMYKENAFWFNADEFFVNTKEEYVKKKSVLPAYTILDENGWHSKGKMGFWGFSDDVVEESVWWDQCTEKLINLDEEVYMTIVDCHI